VLYMYMGQVLHDTWVTTARNHVYGMLATYILIHSFLLVKIYMSLTKTCRFHINLVGLMWILIDQRVCDEKCVIKYVLPAFLMILILIEEYISHPN